MVQGGKLNARLPKVCERCSMDYLAKQQNSKFCKKCRDFRTEKVKCSNENCNKIFTRNVTGLCRSFRTKGKSYEEIYGKPREQITNGFKRGIENPNFTSPSFQHYKKKKKNSRGENFRSSLEVLFSEYLIKRNIPFTYESERIIISQEKGIVKVIDFIVNNCIYVEITGYCSESWQKEFNYKCSLLRETFNNRELPVPLLLLTYPENLKTLSLNLNSKDTFIENIYEEERIINKIILMNNMTKLNLTIDNKMSGQDLLINA